jgi:translocator protein
MNHTKKAWINGLFLIATLVVNGIGASGIINGLNQKEISDMYLTLITPIPSTFSIWSLIYILLFASIIVMIFKKKDEYYQKAINEISLLFRISCLFNIVWIVLFSFLLVEISSLFIFGFLITLSFICLKLRKIHEKNRFLLPLAFGLYTGWLMIATVVNIAASLVKIQWNGFGISQEILAAITLIVAIILVFLVLQSNKNVVFPLPIAWAYFGIYQFLIAPEGFDGAYGLLQMVSLGGMVILIGMAAIQLYMNKFALIVKK